MATNGATRAEQVAMVEVDRRHIWLAAEVDSLEGHIVRIEKKLSQLLLAAVGILISTLSTTVTLILAWVAT